MTIPDAVETPILSPDMAGTLMTPEEFDLAELDPDDASRYELIHSSQQPTTGNRNAHECRTG